MIKRPKSREETPKEGSDSASATAPQQYATALHKTQELLSYFRCKMPRRARAGQKSHSYKFYYFFQIVTGKISI
jgi:hypothetical protein